MPNRRSPKGHVHTVLRNLGVVLHVPGVMALVSIPVSLFVGEAFAVAPFAATAALSLLTGQALFRKFRQAAPMRLRHAMVTTVVSWAVTPIIGAVPFVLLAGGQPLGAAGVFQDFWNALFESVSGFTSTGLTMVLHPGELPLSLQWWRSFSQWVGGAGVVLLALTVFHPSADAERLYFAEGRDKKLAADITSSVQAIWRIYTLFTALAVLALRLAGLSWWQAVNYGMAGIATGGFGITDNSMGDFGLAARFAAIFIIVLGAISFRTHYRILRERSLRLLWSDREAQVFLLLLPVGAAVLAVENFWSSGRAEPTASLFQWSSALTTSGFSTVDVGEWSPAALLLLSIAMICGGASGSTSGGVKIRRCVCIVEGAYARVRGIALHPWRLLEHRPIADKAAEAHEVRLLEAATVMAALWLLAVLGGVILLLHAVGPAARLDKTLFEVTSALSNVGLSSGVTSPDLPWIGKCGLIVLMWMGRLEIVPVLVLGSALLLGRHPSFRHAAANRHRG